MNTVGLSERTPANAGDKAGRAPQSNINRDPSGFTLTWASAPCVCRVQTPEEHIASWK